MQMIHSYYKVLFVCHSECNSIAICILIVARFPFLNMAKYINIHNVDNNIIVIVLLLCNHYYLQYTQNRILWHCESLCDTLSVYKWLMKNIPHKKMSMSQCLIGMWTYFYWKLSFKRLLIICVFLIVLRIIAFVDCAVCCSINYRCT